MKIFIDESGDLGFSARSSKWFLITLVLTARHRKLEKAVKKVHKNLRKKDRTVTEMHAYHEKPVTRKRVLRHISQIDDIQILSVILNKAKVYTKLRDQKAVLYNYVTNILLDRLHHSRVLSDIENIEICIDQKETNKFLNTNFLTYLQQGVDSWKKDAVKIRLAHSHAEKCLQATDFVSWAIYRKYERGESDYYDLLKDKIIGEDFLFK